MTPEQEQVEDRRFRAAVAGSLKAVLAFEAYLKRKGYETIVTEVKMRTRVGEKGVYSDGEDLLARKPGEDRWRRFEIKGRTLTFTSCADFPFPTIIADHANKTFEPPDWYVNVSKDLKYAAVMDGKLRDQWTVSHIEDTTKRTAASNPSLMCPKEQARFVRIAE
jgi:hypothetical protein